MFNNQNEDLRVLKFKRSNSAEIDKKVAKIKKRSSISQDPQPKIELKKRSFPYQIPLKPHRILAAPDLKEHQNLVDWQSDILALALDDTIYIKKTSGNKEDDTQNVEAIFCKKEITSLCLNKHGDAVVVGMVDSLVGVYRTKETDQVR